MRQPKVAFDAFDSLRLSVQGRWYLENACVVEVAGARKGRWGLGGCHANAAWLSRRWPQHYRWWTGYAVSDLGMVDNHSWVQRPDGSHLEVTYDQPASAYLGVPVPAAVTREHVAACTFHPNECVALFAAGLMSHGPLMFSSNPVTNG